MPHFIKAHFPEANPDVEADVGRRAVMDCMCFGIELWMAREIGLTILTRRRESVSLALAA